MEKIAIIALSDDPFDPPGAGRYGGAQLFIFDLARHFVRNRRQVHIITRRSREDKPAEQSLGPLCKVSRVDMGSALECNHHVLLPFLPAAIEQTRAALAKSDDFTGVLSSNWISGLVAIELGISPHVHHILSLGRIRKQLGEEEDKADAERDRGEVTVFAAAERLVCVCPQEKKDLLALYPEIDPKKVTIVPYGIDTNEISPRPTSASDYLRRSSERVTQRP